MTDFSFIYLYTFMSSQTCMNFFLSWNKEGKYVWHFFSVLFVLKWSMELVHSVPNFRNPYDTLKENIYIFFTKILFKYVVKENILVVLLQKFMFNTMCYLLFFVIILKFY